MVCDASRSLEIAANCHISSHRVAGPIVCDGLRRSVMLLESSESQQSALFHPIVWPGLRGHVKIQVMVNAAVWGGSQTAHI